jgi:NAD(P)H-flavin reductase
MKVDAGQYVNLWMPTVSLFSWAQTHPFTVTSWSRGQQTTLDLYVNAQRGLSATLLDRARRAPDGSVSVTAFVTGPHGTSEPVNQYESILLIASGPGIAAVIPYLKKLIYVHNTSTCRTRRVHVVWQPETLGKSVHDVL